MGSEARQGLQQHPTVKPVAMLEDTLMDVTNRGDIVLDPSSIRDQRLLPQKNAPALPGP